MFNKGKNVKIQWLYYFNLLSTSKLPSAMRFKERGGGGGEMATGDILIFNYSNYVMIYTTYYQKQRGRDVGVDGE
jgi:hypothetical protein